MRVERLIVGWFTAAVGIWRRGDDMDRQVRFPVPAYLIETGDERILVDTGMHPDAVTDPTGRYGRPDALGPVKAELERSACVLVALDGSRGERGFTAEAPPLKGSPEQLAATLRDLGEAGADEAILVVDPITEDSVRELGEVVGLVRA